MFYVFTYLPRLSLAPQVPLNEFGIISTIAAIEELKEIF